MTSQPAPTSKRIVLFSDGTGNSSAKAQKTNVWRFFQALDQGSADQIARYDDGVGTSSNKYLAILGGAFGWGLKRNVIDLYKFVCRNYCAGDKIYGFGFSRGAFTIRVLVGLIAREGLVTFRSEEELDRHAAAAYRSFRSKAFPSKTPIIWTARRIRDGLFYLRDLLASHHTAKEVSDATKLENRDRIPIHFLGLWDTVEAYGMPIVELKRGIDWLLWPMLFGDMKLSSTVERAVHALSLDDERTTFHPLLWDELWETQLVKTQQVPAGRMTQVWFIGVHSNVGGGYPEDQTSLVPLEWILSEGQRNGLRLTAGGPTEFRANMSPYAKVYNSRAGLAAFYRYSPRTTPVVMNGDQQLLVNVHWTVLARMVHGTDAYAPITLPHVFNVLTPAGTLVDFQALRTAVTQGATTGNAELNAAMKALGAPDHDQVGLVWDTVFWRRLLYAMTMLLAALAAAFPLYASSLPTGWWDKATGGIVHTVVDGLGGLIPSAARWWKEAFVSYPLEFGFLLIAVFMSLAGSEVLAQRIHDRAWLVWHQSPMEPYRAWRSERRNGFARLMVTGFIILGLSELAVLIVAPDNRLLLQIDIITGAVSLIILSIFARLGRRQPAASAATRLRNTPALKLARAIRRSTFLNWAYATFTERLFPVVFVVLIVIAAGILLNRAAFDIANSTGAFCTPTTDVQTERLGQATGFTTDKMCWASGLVLEKGHRYIITLSTPKPLIEQTDRWFDKAVPTDVNGFPTDSVRHWLAKPLTRWWGENWFRPIARIGRFGNDEYALESLDDVKPIALPPTLPKDLVPPDAISAKISEALAGSLNTLAPLADDRYVMRAIVRARTTGELFLYVNDAALALPWNPFYANNSGRASVQVERLSARALGPSGTQVAVQSLPGVN